MRSMIEFFVLIVLILFIAYIIYLLLPFAVAFVLNLVIILLVVFRAKRDIQTKEMMRYYVFALVISLFLLYVTKFITGPLVLLLKMFFIEKITVLFLFTLLLAYGLKYAQEHYQKRNGKHHG